jgi:signal transduction histidine kinase/DNA-binding response OmpR family regulator
VTKRILLIHEDKSAFTSFSKLLAQAETDLDLDWVGSYDEGLDRVLRSTHDVYLVDERLGRRGGLGLIREAISAGAKSPLIALTSSATMAACMQFTQDGAADVLNSAALSPDLLERAVLMAMERTKFAQVMAASDASRPDAAKEELEKVVQQLTILREVEDDLTRTLNIDHVLRMALDSAVRLSTANSGFIALKADDNTLQLATVLGAYNPDSEHSGLNSTRIQSLVSDPEPEPRLIIDTRRLSGDTQELAVHAQMLLPLMAYDRLIGVMNLETSKPLRFTEDTFKFIKQIAVRVAVALDNAQLYQIAQDQLAQLQDLYDQVTRLERMKTDMIRIAAHDLRNPTGVIVGYLELMQTNFGENLTPKQGHYMDAMDRAARRMQKITTDILSLERIENLSANKLERLDLSPLIEELARDLEPEALGKEQTFTLQVPMEKVIVDGDSVQLREAAVNLISNAIKYTPRGGAIRVSLEAIDRNAVFSVVDNGYGVPEDQQARLFQPFFRAQSAETKEIDGTGLGLHLVKNVVERMGGAMIFHSVYGEGSTFGFRLPLRG